MSKIKGLSFWLFAIVYLELVWSCLIFKTFPTNIGLILLFSIPAATVFNIITNSFKDSLNKILIYLVLSLIIFIFGAQLVYYSMYQAIISFFSIMNGGQVTEFMEVIFDKILTNWFGIVLLCVPMVILIVLHKKEKITFESDSKKEIFVKILGIIIIQIISILIVNLSGNVKMYSNKNLYYNIHVPKVTANRMGLITTMRLDFQRFLFGFEEKVSFNNESVEVVIEQGTKYNALDIDFEKLANEETVETIKEMHQYFAAQTPMEQNEYTGMFDGKNLVVFVAEGFSSLAIREDVTPTLYKLYKEGFQFDNFYTPVFPVSTADGEYITDTSLIPKEGVWSLYRIKDNYMPYSYANVFEPLGYSSNAYHNHTYTYYHRDEYIAAMGYDSYLAAGNGLEKRMDCSYWPNSDYEMVKTTVDDYINNEHFMAYYMTVSGHLNYTTYGNSMASRNWDAVKDLPYSHKASAYLATNIELDKAISELITRLEQAGKLEDTVIVISADHYPYGLTLEEINELSTYERDDTFEKFHMPLLIWSGSMDGPVKVENLGSSLDVLPTVLNLFGINYDSRLLVGTDILANQEEHIIIFSDRSFITNKGRYNAVKGEFVANPGVNIEDGYVDKMNKIVFQKYKISRMILENDYYRKLWTKLGWEVRN